MIDLSIEGKAAAKPLFRDPVYDGAADPVLIYNRARQTWWMFYTNRRANDPSLPGVSWLHGKRLGIAESVDFGATWRYRGVANIPLGGPDDAHWAPDILFHEGTYHMYLSFVPGIHEDWSGTRHIHHLTSPDLEEWQWQSELDLSSKRVIDASVCRLEDGRWRLFYKEETDRDSIHYAESDDLFNWTDVGRCVSDVRAEGPKCFYWRGHWRLITDTWHGLAVYKSVDALSWTAQDQRLLAEPGAGLDDQVIGGHADVVVADDRAFLFYFTHPGRRGKDAEADTTEQRRTSIQVTELFENGHGVWCDRDRETLIKLTPPRT